MTIQRIIPGDCIEGLRTLPNASVHCCVTSPPYWGLRDYGHDGQIGLESTPEAYVARMVDVFREVRRVLRDDGTLWLNLGDSYAGSGPSGASYQSETTRRRAQGDGVDGAFRVSKTLANRGLSYSDKKPVPPSGLKSKDLVGIPWRVAFALQADGWWLRQDIIWHKPNPMPESVRDRCTKAHEYVFLLTKSERYYYDAEALRETCSYVAKKYSTSCGKITMQEAAVSAGQSSRRMTQECRRRYVDQGRNRRSVWTITTKPYSGAHFAVMPADLVEPCIRAGTSEEGCCSACGAPWERVVERGDVPMTARRRRLSMTQRAGHPAYAETLRPSSLGAGSGGDVPARSITTTGWQPSCDCGTQPVPCAVLDPFAGSGTTLAVAAELGRNAIGCELNPAYIALAERRIKDARATVALFEGVPA